MQYDSFAIVLTFCHTLFTMNIVLYLIMLIFSELNYLQIYLVFV